LQREILKQGQDDKDQQQEMMIGQQDYNREMLKQVQHDKDQTKKQKRKQHE
jgi:hypothetical protein